MSKLETSKFSLRCMLCAAPECETNAKKKKFMTSTPRFYKSFQSYLNHLRNNHAIYSTRNRCTYIPPDTTTTTGNKRKRSNKMTTTSRKKHKRERELELELERERERELEKQNQRVFLVPRCVYSDCKHTSSSRKGFIYHALTSHNNISTLPTLATKPRKNNDYDITNTRCEKCRKLFTSVEGLLKHRTLRHHQHTHTHTRTHTHTHPHAHTYTEEVGT